MNNCIKVKVLPKSTQEGDFTENFLAKFCETERIVSVSDIDDYKENKEVYLFLYLNSFSICVLIFLAK